MNERFIYKLVIKGVTYQVNPLGQDGLKIKSEAESGQIFHRRKLSGSLKFTKSDFNLLYNLEKSGDRCETIGIHIYKLCSGEYKMDWSGIFSLNEVKWNVSRGEAVVTPRPDDKYRLVLDYYSKEYNVLQIPASDTVKVKLDFDNQFEFFSVGTPEEFQDIEDSDTWAVFLEMNYWIDGTAVQKGKRNRTQIYFRLVTSRPFENNAPPDLSNAGWRMVDEDIAGQVAKYAKAPDLYNFVPYRFNTKSDFLKYPDLLVVPCDNAVQKPGYILISDPGDANGCFDLRQKINFDIFVKFQWEFGRFYFNRNRKLLNVIKFLLSQTCPVLEPLQASDLSEFFTDATNYVTTNPNQLINLLIAQKSDILSWNSSEPATKGMLSLKNLLEDLKAMFGVHWFINAAGKFQLEHISYFENVGVFDLTIKLPEFLVGNHTYDYKTEDMPRFEKLTFAESLNEDFTQGVIEYGGACVNYEEGQDTKEFNVTRIVTDLEYLLTASGSNKTGFVLLVNQSGEIPKEAGSLTGDLLPNAHLSAANLMEHYYTHERVLYTGVVNGKSKTFKSVRKTKKQTTLTIKPCCTEVNPFFEYITNIGPKGKLLSAELSLKTGNVTLDIVFETTGSGTFGEGRQFSDSFNDSWR